MSYYYAEFQTIVTDCFRWNTRVYLDPHVLTQPAGTCVGAVVAKNPGSATSGGAGWQALTIGNDQMLPNVCRIFNKAYADPIYFSRSGTKGKPDDAYVQILNLFYLCDPNLHSAMTKIGAHTPPPTCASESTIFPLIWFAWGGPHGKLNAFESRFAGIKATDYFFYHPKQPNPKVIACIPTIGCFAKHPQGLAHANIVPHLASILP